MVSRDRPRTHVVTTATGTTGANRVVMIGPEADVMSVAVSDEMVAGGRRQKAIEAGIVGIRRHGGTTERVGIATEARAIDRRSVLAQVSAIAQGGPKHSTVAVELSGVVPRGRMRAGRIGGTTEGLRSRAPVAVARAAGIGPRRRMSPDVTLGRNHRWTRRSPAKNSTVRYGANFGLSPRRTLKGSPNTSLLLQHCSRRIPI